MRLMPLRAVATALLATAVAVSPGLAAQKSINIGWTAWSDAEAVTKMAGKILEERLGYKVTLTLADIAIQYEGVARGDLDAMLMSWLPKTHKDYFHRFGLELDDVGPLYTRARLGWAVPDYVPIDKLRSIADLAKGDVARKLSRQIQGIDPGAGLMRLSQKAIEDYGLDRYSLISASGAAMTAALDRAIRRHKWIVVTAWSPHWMFAKWKLRYLEDPKKALGGYEHVDALVRHGLADDAPDAFGFLARMYLPLGDLEAVMDKANDTSYDAAVDAYIKANPKRVSYWVTGRL